jgi:hypothetical protein
MPDEIINRGGRTKGVRFVLRLRNRCAGGGRRRLFKRHRGEIHRYRVRWDQLDLSDREHPRLTCPLEELEPIGAPRRRHRKTHAA